MKGLGQQICEYCGSPVVPVDTRVWRMVRFLRWIITMCEYILAHDSVHMKFCRNFQ